MLKWLQNNCFCLRLTGRGPRMSVNHNTRSSIDKNVENGFEGETKPGQVTLASRAHCITRCSPACLLYVCYSERCLNCIHFTLVVRTTTAPSAYIYHSIIYTIFSILTQESTTDSELDELEDDTQWLAAQSFSVPRKLREASNSRDLSTDNEAGQQQVLYVTCAYIGDCTMFCQRVCSYLCDSVIWAQHSHIVLGICITLEQSSQQT